VKNEPTRVKKEPTQPSQEIPPGIDNVAEPIFLPSASQLGAVENSEAKETEASANANERHAAPVNAKDDASLGTSVNAEAATLLPEASDLVH